MIRGAGFIAGLSPPADPDDAPLEPEYEAFESSLWPALAARVPAFEAAKLERAWAGYYEMNVFDHNGVVGLHPEDREFRLYDARTPRNDWLHRGECETVAMAQLSPRAGTR
jgi:glycine/D-amino acid oxidase-like deaminating enzyme